MILTVTLNPLLERRITYTSIKTGSINRNGDLEIKSGGKGINVSRQLNNLSINNLTLTFAGGSSGKELKEVLHSENIHSVLVHTESKTREALIIIEKSPQSITSCFGLNSQITAKEADEFRTRLEKMIPNYEMIILSGSSPCKETDYIFPSAIKCANEHDKITICDTYGNHLNDCINSSPTIIHNNLEEIERSLNINLQSEEEKGNFLNLLYNNNIKQVYLSDGDKRFYASNFDYHFRITPPSIKTIDSTGSGDAFTAGIAYGWHHDMIFEEILRIASALGAANAKEFDVCNVKKNGFEDLKTSVIIEPIGKKMKLIDVTPQSYPQNMDV